TEAVVAVVPLLVLVPLLLWAMRRGWQARARRQAHVPAPPPAPQAVDGEVLGGVDAVYVTTTSAGRPLDRVVVHGLGVRSNAVVTVSRAGVLVAREGAPDVWVPTDAVRGARRQRGMVGKTVEKEGLVVLTWQLGDEQVDTGLRVRRDADRRRLVDAVRTLVAVAG
ncbi:MAG: hypothetical protein ACLGIV_09775, partial [Actinomycetes bacterium]